MYSISLRFALGMLVVFGLAVVPVPARAANVTEMVHADYRWAAAEFTTPDTADTCVETTYSVRLTDDLHVISISEPGKPFMGSFSSAGMSIVGYNSCTRQVIRYDECSTTDPAGISIAPSLGKATVNAVVECWVEYDWDAPHFWATFNVAWQGTGRVVRRFSTEHQTETGEKLTTILSSEVRDATASGTILIDGVNVIPEPSTSGTLEAQSRLVHTLEICKLAPGFCPPE